MEKKLRTLLASGAVLAFDALPALAQQTQGPRFPWSGPWWSDGWPFFWWMCPLMMLGVFGALAFVMLARRH